MTNDSKISRANVPSCTLEQLEAIGVTMQSPRREKTYFVFEGEVWVQVGIIGMHESDGRIQVVPREGLTGREMEQLLGFADNAFRSPPNPAEAWTRDKHCPEWWITTAAVLAGLDEAAAELAAEAERFLRDTLVTTIDADAPIDMFPTEKAWEV